MNNYDSYLDPDNSFIPKKVRVKPDRLSNRRRESKFRTERFANRSKGLAYLTQRKDGAVELVEAKMAKRIRCKCKRKCYDKFTDSAVQNLLNVLYQTGNVTTIRNFILNHCQRWKGQGKRNYRYLYTLPSSVSIANRGKKVSVCKQFFLGVLDCSPRFITYTFDKKRGPMGLFALEDQRGKHNNRPKALSSAQFDEIVATISNEQIMPSHYGRKRSLNKVYFDKTKSFRSLHRSYTTRCLEKRQQYLDQLEDIDDSDPDKEELTKLAIAQTPVKIKTFTTAVKAGFPELSFRKKTRDKCSTCRRYETDPRHVRNVPLYLEHLRCKDAARNAMKTDSISAKEEYQNHLRNQRDIEFIVLQFDFMKNLEVVVKNNIVDDVHFRFCL